MPTVRLRAKHVLPVWSGHPWVFAQAVERVEGGATAGDEVTVIDARDRFLGRGLYSPGSAIPVRLLVRNPDTKLDGAFFRNRIARAIALRKKVGLPSADTTGYRLVHAEGDGLPGFVCDRFGDTLVVQLATIGMKQREGLLFEALDELLRPRAIIDRTPASVERLEQFRPSSGVVRGDEVSELVFAERGLRFRIPLELGQKTGYYFDQRDLRARVETLSQGMRVLDAYSYVGSFSLAAARGGAKEVLGVDENALAVSLADEFARDNGLSDRVRFVRQNARAALAQAAESGGYDLVIVDPPRLAPTRSARDQALVAYARIAENACRATRPGGMVIVCSCSAAVDLTALTRALARGVCDAGRDATILERYFQGPDHPVLAAFPEGLYLKAILARVDSRNAGRGD